MEVTHLGFSWPGLCSAFDVVYFLSSSFQPISTYKSPEGQPLPPPLVILCKIQETACFCIPSPLYSPALTKSMNMDIWVVDRSNQLTLYKIFFPKQNFKKNEAVTKKNSALWKCPMLYSPFYSGPYYMGRGGEVSAAFFQNWNKEAWFWKKCPDYIDQWIKYFI